MMMNYHFRQSLNEQSRKNSSTYFVRFCNYGDAAELLSDIILLHPLVYYFNTLKHENL